MKRLEKPKAWQRYQHEVAAFFRSLNLNAQINVRIKGVRTSHDIDVLVESRHVGFTVTWLVECKCWKTRVSKLHVLALREIVSDTGADRGILLSEAGYQSGALEAAALTNVEVTSLANVRSKISTDVSAMRVRELYDRMTACHKLYWDIPKVLRIKHGLRQDVGAAGYSGARMLEYTNELVTKAFRGVYPVDCESLVVLSNADLPRSFATATDLVDTAENVIGELESRLKRIEQSRKNKPASRKKQRRHRARKT